jgi:oligosaccharide reducing-end xylanase
MSSPRACRSPLVLFSVLSLGLLGTACSQTAKPAVVAPVPALQGAPAQGRVSRDLFSELLGRSSAEVDARIAATFQQLFHGDDATQRVYYPVGADSAYILDTGNVDVRSEGMSYGMMIAVQLGKREEFDRLWTWAKRHMLHTSGERSGYFAWQCRPDGSQIDPGQAPDGEEWFVTALFVASRKWGDASGKINYRADAQAILDAIMSKPTGSGEVRSSFDRKHKQVVFSPSPGASQFTDPSYHLPAFYEQWAREAARDQQFWREVAVESRAFFRRGAHPVTGLMPEYAEFDGRPRFGGGREDFRFDAWRVLANVAMDHVHVKRDPWNVEQSNRVLRFLLSQKPTYVDQFSLEGKPLSADSSIGLTAMAAVAGLAADPELARPFVKELWEAPVPAGKWRYYNGLLYMIGMLQASGRFGL